MMTEMNALIDVDIRIEKAGVVSIIRTFDIVMAFVLQVLFLKQAVVWTSIVGAVIVFSTILIVYANKHMAATGKSWRDLLPRRLRNRQVKEDKQCIFDAMAEQQA